ncbi:MAG: hypothetical protein LQ340_007657 [Diploschistes diacapsis]|nr:MAG: hypothetical protein LQ340_007657 [Diploschistes diacapsis]
MLPALEYLLKHLEDLRRIYKDDVWIQIRIDAAWDKLNKYYNKTDDTMAYMAATVLNPLYKWKYFEGVWTEDVLKQWLRQGKSRLVYMDRIGLCETSLSSISQKHVSYRRAGRFGIQRLRMMDRACAAEAFSSIKSWQEYVRNGGKIRVDIWGDEAAGEEDMGGETEAEVGSEA